MPAPAVPPDAAEVASAPADAAGPAVDAAAAPAATVPADLELRLERTACLGTCPSYVVTVNAAGEVFFAGWYPAKGCATATIGADAVAALVARVDAIGYFGLKDRYTYSVTDHPWANTAVTMGGRRKVVQHYLADWLGLDDLAERQALVTLEEAIDDAAGVPLSPLGPCRGRSPYPGVP